MKNTFSPTVWRIAFYVLGVAMLLVFAREHYLVFHTSIELFSYAVGVSVFLVAWNARHHMEHDFFLALGIILLVTGCIDFIHVLVSNDVHLFTWASENDSWKLWITARFLQSSAIAASTCLCSRPPQKEWKRYTYLFVSLVVCFLLAILIVRTDLIPTFFVARNGRTSFKIAVEALIVFLFAVGFIRVWKEKNTFSQVIFRLLSCYFGLLILSELIIAVYGGVNATLDILGHILRGVAALLLYHSILVIGIREPVELLFRELADRETRLAKNAAELEKALEEKNLLMLEISHRFKNNFNIIVSMLGLKEAEETSPELIQSYRDISRRVRSMALVHDKLHKSRDVRFVEFRGYVVDVCEELLSAYSLTAPGIRIVYDIEDVCVPVETASILGMLLTELVTNALKHAFPSEFTGEKGITVRFGRGTDGRYALKIQDTGIGIHKNFSAVDSNSLGHRIVPALVRQIGATLAMEEDGGVRWTIRLSDESMLPSRNAGIIAR